MATAQAVVALGRAHQLSAYDAAYLELAVREALPVATLDQRLALRPRRRAPGSGRRWRDGSVALRGARHNLVIEANSDRTKSTH